MTAARVAGGAGCGSEGSGVQRSHHHGRQGASNGFGGGGGRVTPHGTRGGGHGGHGGGGHRKCGDHDYKRKVQDVSHLSFWRIVGIVNVPEPGSLSLILVGLAGVGVAARRKRKKKA